jgi:MFS family permease
MDHRTPSGRLLPITGPLISSKPLAKSAPAAHVPPASRRADIPGETPVLQTPLSDRQDTSATNSAPAATKPAPSLWKNRSFTIFWGGQTLASLGNMFSLIAMPLLVLQATGQVVQMGLVTATFTISQLLAGVFAGQLVDTLNRRVLMIICDAGRMVIFATIPLAWWLAGPQIWLIYVVTASGAVLGMIFQVGFIAAVPNLVEREQIITANGYINASSAITALIGPLLGGWAVEHFGPSIALSGQAAAFAVSAFSLLFVRLRPVSAQNEPEAAEQTHSRSALLAGVRFLFAQPVLRAVTLILIAFSMVMAAGLDLFIFHIKSDLHQDGTAIGLVFATSSIGAILGSLAAGLLRKRLGFGITYLGSLVLSGLPLALVGVWFNLYALAALAALVQLSNMVMGINSMSLRQEITPDALIGRVTAAFWTISGVATPLGAALGTALAARIGAPATFVWMGTLVMAIGIAGFFTSARQRRPAGSVISEAQPESAAPAAIPEPEVVRA